jgi:uncharacterized protein YjdB
MSRASRCGACSARSLVLPIALLATALATHPAAAQPALEAASASPVVAIGISPGVFTSRSLVEKQLTASAILADGSQSDVTAKLKWSSSDSSIASVGNGARGGLVETLGLGTATITASDTAGHSGTATIVVDAELVGLEVTPASLTLRGGMGRSLAAQGTFSDGKIVPLRKIVHWSSSDETIATVSNAAGKIGLVVGGNTLGTATITARADGGSAATQLSATAQVTVSSLLTAFDLSPKSLTLRVKKTKHVTALGSFSDGTTGIDITRFVEPESSNPAVAIARNRPRKGGEGIGAVTGVSKGTAQVTAKSTYTGVVSSNAVAVRVR